MHRGIVRALSNVRMGTNTLPKWWIREQNSSPSLEPSHLETNKETDVPVSTVRVTAASTDQVHPPAKEGIFAVFNLIWSYFL